MKNIELVEYFCEEILDIVCCRAEEVLNWDTARKIRDIGDEIVNIVETTMEGYLATHDLPNIRAFGATPDSTLFDFVESVVIASQKKYGWDDAI